MATKHQGDVLSLLGRPNTVLIICMNSAVRSDGERIMLNGAAGRLAAKMPLVPKQLGKAMTDKGEFWHIICPPSAKIGVFQNEHLPKNGPDLKLISHAAKLLREVAQANPDKVYALEHPGGKEPDFLFESIYRILPDNVQVWKL